MRLTQLEARTANTVATQYPEGRILFYDQVSLEFILQSIPPSIKQDIHGLIFSSCTPLEKSEFTQTIRLYFDRKGDIHTARTGAILSI